VFIFGGGAQHVGYRCNFREGLVNAGIHDPQVHDLPAATDLNRPNAVNFGRYAVAYGLSFFRPNLDRVRLPQEFTAFRELYPELAAHPAEPYGFNWED
jgi:hypothetical protein